MLKEEKPRFAKLEDADVDKIVMESYSKSTKQTNGLKKCLKVSNQFHKILLLKWREKVNCIFVLFLLSFRMVHGDKNFSQTT